MDLDAKDIIHYLCLFRYTAGFLGGKVVQNFPANIRDPGLIPGSGRVPGEGSHSSILVWRIPWTEEPGGLQSIGLQRVGCD